MNSIIVDTGFLVALFRRSERRRGAAREFLLGNARPLVTVAPVVVETCFFLNFIEKDGFLEWIGRGALDVVDVPAPAYPLIRGLIRKYANRDIDFADAAIVWYSIEKSLISLLTVDVADFSVFRLGGGRRFDLLDW